MASTPMRRRVLESAALAEWSVVREAVEKEGCNVNIQDEETGLTLAHWAAHQGDEETLRWLIERGAFLRLKNKRGEAALSGARGGASQLLLQEAYRPVERVVCQRGLPTEERLVAELGADAEAAVLNEPLWDEGGATLAGALAGRHGGDDGLDALPLLRWLAARGADLEATDEEGNAVLHLLDWNRGADVILPVLTWALRDVSVAHRNMRNVRGETPALLCAYESATGEDALRYLEVLVESGANLSVGNAKGMDVAMVLARYQGEGPWLEWCHTKGGVDTSARCAIGLTAADYLTLHGTEESEEDADA